MEPVELPLACLHCAGAVVVQAEYDVDRDTLNPVTYDCPWCGKRNAFALPGRLVWVARRDAKKDITDPATKN